MSWPSRSARQLDEYEAREVTDQVKADARALWANLLWLYEGGAHTALGYPSWSDYCAAEFEMGKTAAYRLLQAARVVAELPMGNSALPSNERQARELARVPEPEQRAEVWQAVVEQHGPEPTAKQVREAVEERRPELTPKRTYTPMSFVPGPQMPPVDIEPVKQPDPPVSTTLAMLQRLPEERLNAVADMFLDAQLPDMVAEVVLTAAQALLRPLRAATKELGRIDWNRVTDEMRADTSIVTHIGYLDEEIAKFETALQAVRLPVGGLRRIK